MRTWWAMVRNQSGGYFRVTVQAATAYDATQMLRAQYGSQLLSESANLLN